MKRNSINIVFRDVLHETERLINEAIIFNSNKKLNNELENESFKFLNAGVASYSSYIYLKKIETVINENKDLKVKNVIVFLDKSEYSSAFEDYKQNQVLCNKAQIKDLEDELNSINIDKEIEDIEEKLNYLGANIIRLPS